MRKCYYILILVFSFFWISGKAVTNTAILSGAWETGTHWSLGHAPLATEDVVVPSGFSMTVNAADVCLSLTINGGGTVTIVGAQNLSIAGNFSNSGTFTAATAGSKLTFNAAVNSIVSGTGAYTFAGTVVLNMGAMATSLDVQSVNFCTALTGSFILTQGTWRMDNTGTIANFYTGAATTLTIPNTVVIESDQGTMDLCNAGTTGNVLLEGELYMNGGSVYVESGQGYNAGDDFQYKVVGGISPVLKFVNGNLYVFAGFNPSSATDYINFNMSGGTMTCAYSVGTTHGGYSDNGTFELQDVVGGQTVMTGGTVILQDADNSATQNDLNMGGSNVAATLYSVTGGTIQFGAANTQASSTFFGITPYPTTNYPNFVFAAGTAKTASPYFSSNTLNLLSLNINANMTFDISQYNNNVNFESNNGTFALQVLGTLVVGTGTYTFSGAANQLVTSSLATLTFPSLVIANTGGATTTFGGSLATLTTGNLTMTSGNLTPGTVTTLTVNGITTLTAGSFTAPTALNQKGNWLNNGGAFIPGTNTVTMDGAAAQTLGGTTSTAFYNLTCNGTTITLGDNETIKNTLQISAGTLDASATNYNLTVGQNFTNDGTFTARNATVTFTGNTTTPLNINGTASITFYNLTTNTTNSTDVLLLGRATTVNNAFTITKGVFDVSASNYALTVNGNFLNNSGFTARAGTVTMSGAAAQTLGGTLSTTFFNLTCNGTTITLGDNETIGNTLLISGGTLDASTSNYNLTVGQNFTNDGTFTPRNATVTLTGNTTTPLNIGGTAVITFYNLITNPTNATDVVLMGKAITINNNFTISKGIFNSQNFQITGNATGTMSMAANTGLLLGLTTVATSVLFPTNYIAANIALNITSTVTYQANVAQVVSAVPTYGNVIVTNGNAAAVKTPSGTPLNIDGNLTITKGAGALTLSQTTNTINLSGNYLSTGILSFSTGNFNIGGNYTNDGTFTAGTSTVTFDGTAAQSLGGTSVTTFNLLTINNSTNSTITLGINAIVASNFLITKGIFDVSASNFALSVAGNFTNNSGFTARAGTVTLNGAAAQSLGGTLSTTFYNLTCNGTTVTLGNNETIDNTLQISGGTLDASVTNYNLTVGQNFTNDGTFTPRNGLVTLTGNTSSPLNINGTVNTTFYNLTTNPTNATDVVLLGRATTVNNNFTISNGIFNSQNFQITGNATGTMSMAANTGLLLGLTTVATNILFPTGYTAAHATLNVTSTVTYQANVAQTISAVPTYGNVVITNGAAAVTKTPSATPLTIDGNLTITKGTGALTVSQTTNTIDLLGNFTSNGILSFSTGNFNIGGNYTNNGTFTAGTGTVTFDGTAAQSLAGSSVTTFHLLTINNSTASTITLGNNVIVGSTFTITKGTFDVSASNYSVSVAGGFLNSSGFNARAGTVTMNGAAAQSFGGTATTTFYSLTLSGTIITLNHNESLQAVLTVNSGALNGPDTLTMTSTAALTARIAPVAVGASIGATFTMQRYITGTVANYQALSSPAKATILRDWDDNPDFYMSGVTGNDGNAMVNNTIYYSVYTYAEPTKTYNAVTTDNQPLTPGLGIYLWMGNSLTTFAPFTFVTHGIPNFNTVNYNVTASSNGLNLIGNPYNSPIQWTSFQTSNNTRLSGTFYVFDETTGTWESSNGTVGSGGRVQANPNIIPAHQGFMVTATSAGVISFKEAHKGTTDAPVIRTMQEPQNMMRIALATNANKFSGHAMLQFDDSSSDFYNPAEDALYMKSFLTNAPIVYTLSKDGEQLINNTMPGATDKEVTLYAGGGAEGMYTLTFTNVASLGNYNCVQLEDITNSKWAVVSEGSSYSFTVGQNAQPYKFILHFKSLPPGQECIVPDEVSSSASNAMDGVDVISSQVGAQVIFTMPTAQNVTISVFNTMGEKAEEDIRCNVMDNTVQVPLPSTTDIYIIRVQSPNGVVNKRIYR